MEPRLTWHEYGLGVARAVSLRSEDPWVKVGAAVFRPDNSIAAAGYNGAPSGLDLDWSSRLSRDRFVIHAEVNTLRWTQPNEVKGGWLACTRLPCANCLLTISAHQVKTVIYDEVHGRGSEALEVAGLLGLEMICLGSGKGLGIARPPNTI